MLLTEKEAEVLHEEVGCEREDDDLLHFGVCVQLRGDVARGRHQLGLRGLMGANKIMFMIKDFFCFFL